MSDAQTAPRPPQTVEEERGTEPADGPFPESASEMGGADTLPLDQVFDVLRNERRRRALRFLVENGGRVELGELAEHLAAWETGKPVAELTSSERKRVYVALYQCHLPRMDDMEVVEFNKPRGVIELGQNAPALNRYLEDAEELRAGRPWRDDTDGDTDTEATEAGGTMSDAQTAPRPPQTVEEERGTGSVSESEPESGAEPADGPFPESASEMGGADTLPLDQVFDVLRNERRRRALRFLVENAGQAEMSELVEYLAAWETGKSAAELTSGERKRVYVALYQCHLPRMDDMEVVEFDKPRGVVKLGRNAPALYRYLEGTEELRAGRPWRDDTDGDTDTEATEHPWPQYYGVLVLGGASLYLASLAVGGVATQAVVGLILLSIGACSVLHFRDSHALGGRLLASED